MIAYRRSFAVFALTTLALLAAAAADAQSSTLRAIPLTLRRVATVNLAQVAAQGTLNNAARPLMAPAFDPSLYATAVNRRIPRSSLSSAAGAEALIRAASLASPEALSVPLAPSGATMIFGFNGLDALDSAIGNGLDVNAPVPKFGIEPPDQGLCVGNSTVIEMTNLEYREFSTSGTPGTTVNLATLFSVSPTDFLSDPKCYYDPPTNTFFMTATDLTDLTHQSSLLVGVKPAGVSSVTTYAIDTTNHGTNGTPMDPGCPCFGDQPLLGADTNAIVVSANEFSQPLPLPGQGAFNGAEIYLVSKSDLVASVMTPHAFTFDAPIPLAGNLATSIEPATSPDGAFDTANGGTEFLMNSLDFFGLGDNRLAVWAIINTCQLASSPCAELPAIQLPPRILHVRAYKIRNNFSARQPAATTMIPYGNSTGNSMVERIDANDDRLGQVVYANGRLYAALDTQVTVGGSLHAGIEYFIVKPSFRTIRSVLHFSATGTSAYVAHKGLDLSYPSIGVTTGGNAVMAFSLMGSSMNPSAGWIPIANAGPRQIHIAAAGAGPDDGFSGYPNDNSAHSGIARWGDYSAAVADGNNIWMAAEFIPSTCDEAVYTGDSTCGGTRAPEANWGTFISEVTVP